MTTTHICAVNSPVVDSRHSDDGIKRRRQCVKCGKRWTTLELEVPDHKRGGEPSLTTIKRNLTAEYLMSLSLDLKKM